MAATPAIHFVMRNHATQWRDIDSLDESDVELQPRRFVGGRNSWVAQSYVRLRAALQDRGWRVSAGGAFEPGAICVAHRDDANDFRSDAHASFLVVVRADRAPVVACDIAIAQNGLDLRPHERFVPLWPQPGLKPRDEGRRGLRTIAYLGRTNTAPRWFGDADFHRALRLRGMSFDVRYEAWGDYGGVDVALASREEASAVLATKPATKLYNAWLGDVPMLATPEPAYAEVRRSPLDFIEIQSAGDVLHAVDVLRANSSLYDAMVENGRMRSRDYGVEAIRARWLDFLELEALPAFRRTELSGRKSWHFGAMLAQKTLSRMHRVRVAFERGALRRRPGRPVACSGERAAHHLAHVPGQTFGAAD
jgi:hypothetical protein